MSAVIDTLGARHVRYGTFMENSGTSQTLKALMRETPRWADLATDQKEALDQIASKIGRMLTGDHNYIDSWHDIAGYATLIEKRLRGEPL